MKNVETVYLSRMDEIAPFPDRLDTDHYAGDQCMDRLLQLLPKPRGINERVVQSVVASRPVLRGIFSSHSDRDCLRLYVAIGTSQSKLENDDDRPDFRISPLFGEMDRRQRAAGFCSTAFLRLVPSRGKVGGTCVQSA